VTPSVCPWRQWCDSGLVEDTTGDQRTTRVPDEELDIDPDLTTRYRGELFTGIAYEETNGILSAIQTY